MKKLLIVGAQGMLGGALQKEFGTHGYEVTSWDRDECDITNEEELKEKISSLHPDIVINAAAHNGVDKIEESQEEFEKAKLLNAFAPQYLATICQEKGVLFVHYSTGYVFSGDTPDGYTEVDIPHPISKYGETKALGEKLVAESTERYYIIRLSRLFGKSGVSFESKKSFVDTMISLVTEKGKTELDIVDEEVDCPTFAVDLCVLTRQIIESQKPFGIYHGANTGACTWFGFAQKIFEIKNLSIKINPVASDTFPRAAKRPKYSVLVNTKLPPQRNWEDALQEYLLS